jgi:hypothetical protein
MAWQTNVREVTGGNSSMLNTFLAPAFEVRSVSLIHLSHGISVNHRTILATEPT